MSGEKGAKRCDSRPFCTVIASNQLIIGRKEHEIIMKIGAHCRNRRSYAAYAQTTMPLSRLS